MRRARLDRRHPQGHARSARAGAGGGPEDPAGRADRPGLDLRPAEGEGAAADGAAAGAGAEGNGDPFGGTGLARPVHPPIPAEEFDQPELLAAEKEAIGLFVSAHPLKPLREALRARVDCPLSALEDRRDKDLVTVGGIITETKRIRTRNGDQMMFATLDDLAGSVELLVFGNALADYEQALHVDEVVLVKGRVDHKEAGNTCLVVQTRRALRARPAGDRAGAGARQGDRRARTPRGAEPLHLACRRDSLSAETLAELRQAIEDSPGQAEVLLDIDTSRGTRSGAPRRAPSACGTRRAAGRARERARGDAGRRDRRGAQAAGVRRRGFAGAAGASRPLRGAGAAARPPVRACGACAPAALRLRRAALALAGGLEHARQAVELGSGQEGGAAAGAELALADVGVAVAVGAQRRLRVVEVQAAEPLAADPLLELGHHRVDARRACGCHSPRRAGGRSPGTRRGAARRRRPRSGRRAPRSSARACRRRRRCSRGAAGSPRSRRAPRGSRRRRA